ARADAPCGEVRHHAEHGYRPSARTELGERARCRMSTTLVHIGDFHAAPGPRNADRYRALDQIISESLQLPRLGAFLWPGDLFDAASSTEDRNGLDERLQRMADAAPVVICYGNHDRAGDLDGFARLQAKHRIYVIARPQVQVLQLATGELAA